MGIMEFQSFPPKQKDFERFFRSKTLQRARDLLAEDVRILECSSSQLTAEVQGSEVRPYLVARMVRIHVVVLRIYSHVSIWQLL